MTFTKLKTVLMASALTLMASAALAQDVTIAVSMADAYVSFGTAIVSAAILTGPGIVDAANVAATIAGAAVGFR